MDNFILTESNGIIESQKLTKLIENEKDKFYEFNSQLLKLSPEQKTILAVLVEQAVSTHITRYFRYYSSDDWDVRSKEIHLYPDGTCFLRVYSAGHDYSNEGYAVGKYSVISNTAKFNLRVCYIGSLIPTIIELNEEIDGSVTWNSETLNNITSN